jgi:hydrogenase maturation protease
VPAGWRTEERVLVVGIGWRFWRDRAFGCCVIDHLKRQPLPPWLDAEDGGFGALLMLQALRSCARKYRRVFVVHAEERGREKGHFYTYRYDGWLPPPSVIQALVAEAIGGVVAIEPFLILGHYFGILPEEVIVVEAEPLDTDYGDGLSEPMARLVPFVAQEVLALACRSSLSDLPPFRFPVSATAGGFIQRPAL